MFTPRKMHQINVVIFESKLDEVTRAITRLGILHLVRLDEEMPWTRKMKDCNAGKMGWEIDTLLDRISAIMKKMKISKVPEDSSYDSISEFEENDLKGLAHRVAQLESEAEELLNNRKELDIHLKKMRSIFEGSSPLFDLGIMSPNEEHRFLMVRYGRVRHDNMEYINEKTAPLAAVVLTLEARGDEDLILLVGLKKDRLKIKRILREAAFEDVAIPTDKSVASGKEAMSEGILEKIAGVEDEIKQADLKIEEFTEINAPLITKYYQLLRVGGLFMRVKGYMKRTNKTYLFSGWIPSSRKGLVKNEILKAAAGQAIIEIVAPEEVAGVREGNVKVPVLLKHPKFLHPFGMLVSTYGVPSYKVIDPTFLVAISFLLMFGMMFGDVGHGAVLCLIGWLIGFRKRDSNENESAKMVGKLTFYCGLSSIVFGFLFGSIFGLDEVIGGLWRKPMGNVIYFFKIAIYFGIVMISGGIILNIINAVRLRNFKAFFFDHAGVISAAMYWCGIAVVSSFLAGRPISVKLVYLGIGIPLALIFLREPISAVIRKQKPHFEDGILTYIMETVIEIMEIVTGYLGNTVSFIRVAAFSLAHAGLFVAVFSLVDMVKGSSGGFIYSVLILFFGNVLIIALEGLVVTIQVIRLEYYEFFSKFFVGGGVEYKPISVEDIAR